MGRLSALIAVAACALSLAACDDKKEPAASESRSNAILASDAGAPARKTAPAATTAVVKASRRLCEGTATGKAAPRSKLETRGASGAAMPAASIPFGVGKYVWVNFWAAWCAPCKEEIPRLLAFRDKLRSQGVLLELAFVSLDDDERQLTRFFDAQPAAGLRASYWLPDGGERATFLAAVGSKEAPELPMHAIYGPNGQLACSIDGAIEDSDYPALAAVFGAKP